MTVDMFYKFHNTHPRTKYYENMLANIDEMKGLIYDYKQ